MTVGEKIRKFRIDQGYTQKELAIMSGLSESAIRNYELGNRFQIFYLFCFGVSS